MRKCISCGVVSLSGGSCRECGNQLYPTRSNEPALKEVLTSLVEGTYTMPVLIVQ